LIAPRGGHGAIHEALKRGIVIAAEVRAAKAGARPALRDPRARRGIVTPRENGRVELPGCDTLIDDGAFDRVDLRTDADRPKLLLEEERILPPQDAGRRKQHMERERLPILVADPVAIVIAPAPRVQNPVGLRGVVRELADVGVPDPQ